MMTRQEILNGIKVIEEEIYFLESEIKYGDPADRENWEMELEEAKSDLAKLEDNQV